VHNFSTKLKITGGIERLSIFTLFFVFFMHVSTCLLIILASIDNGFSEKSWIDACSGFGETTKDIETYTCGVYFVFTTVSTIGYGDISP